MNIVDSNESQKSRIIFFSLFFLFTHTKCLFSYESVDIIFFDYTDIHTQIIFDVTKHTYFEE